MSERTRSGVEPSGTGQLRTVIAAFYLGLIAVVVAAIFAGRAANGLAVAAEANPTPTPNPLPNPIHFRDPHLLFTVTILRGWHATTATGSATVGNGQGAFTIPAFTITIKPPGGDTKLNGDALIVYEYPLATAAARRWQCSVGDHTNTTIAGLPATQLGGQSVWLLDTAAAHYQIDVAYPGAVIANPGGPAIVHPTPTPAAPRATNQAVMLAIFATFKPTPAQPLTCT
jgi:hypothetical protein